MDFKLLLFIFILFPTFSLFPFKFSEIDISAHDMYGLMYEIKNQKLTIIKHKRTEAGNNKRFYEYIDSSDLEINRDGYFYITVFEEKKCVIPGSRFLYLFPENSNDITLGFQGDFSSSAYVKGVQKEVGLSREFRTFMSVYYAKNLIAKIKSSSSLQEGSITYGIAQLDKRILYNGVDNLAWNGDAQPWVEGVEGSGIGETLKINFSEPSEDVVILNGFVDPLKRHLYRYNNRVKTAIIRSADSGKFFEFEHTFEDVVYFDEIRFPRPVEKVIFEIKDVYPGEKWDDTCISAVLTREPDPFD